MSDDWRTVPAGSVARIEIGGTPAREQLRFWADENNGHPWASIADLTREKVFETAEYISDLGVKSSNVKLVPAGTPIMSFKLTIGRTALAGRDLYTNEAIAAFFFDPGQVDERFLFQILPRSARAVITDVAIKGATLNKKSLTAMPLLLPPVAEQRRIAKVLDLVDEQVRTAEDTLAKLASQAEGLLDDLVSDVSEARREPLAALSIADICYGIVQSGEFRVDGVPVLSIRDLSGDFETGLHRTSAAIDARYRRSRVAPRDVLLSIKGTIGRVGVAPERYAGNISRELARLRFGKDVLPEFARLYFLSREAQRLLELAVVGTTRAEVSIHVLKRFAFPVPSLAAQQRMIDAYRSIERRILAEGQEIQKLRALKRGLADDLLTGRVRIPIGATS